MIKCSGSGCRHAVGIGCACECGGGNHGAKARIAWARALAEAEPSEADSQLAGVAEEARKKARAATAEAQSSLPRNPRRPRRSDATRFFEAARTVEIVDWMMSHPGETEQLGWLADQVGSVCENLLKTNTGQHRRLADHFWCDVVAALVRVLDEMIDRVDALPEAITLATIPEVKERTWERVEKSRGESSGNAPTARPTSRSYQTDTRRDRDLAAELAEAALRKAVEELVGLILNGAIEGVHVTFDGLSVKLRLLGILLCPDPYAHAAVWDDCVVPLLKIGIVARARSYISAYRDMFGVAWQSMVPTATSRPGE